MAVRRGQAHGSAGNNGPAGVGDGSAQSRRLRGSHTESSGEKHEAEEKMTAKKIHVAPESFDALGRYISL
jgi:hypothetical protein